MQETEEARWVERFEEEHDNLRAALGWSGVQGERQAGLRLGGAQGRFWEVLGYWREGREQLAVLLELPGAEARTAARAKALNWAGRLAVRQGDFGAPGALFEESLAISREIGSKWDIAHSLGGLGWTAYGQGDYGAARALFEESLTTFREIGDKPGIAEALARLGLAVREEGNYEAARALFEESLARSRELGRKWGVTWSLRCLGWTALEERDYGGARALFEESLVRSRELGEKRDIPQNLEGLAAVAVAQERSERAARLFGAAEGLRAVIGAPLPRAARGQHDRSVAAVRVALDEEGFAAAWAAGRALSPEEAVDCALAEEV
jgi:tetratricopeptide (TPR) repeat protein